ncbi:MAG: hypothetical protein H6702_10320 [Myxococcales bacterium]|nr:hypothetical protein [Myxococcales bacterium]
MSRERVLLMLGLALGAVACDDEPAAEPTPAADMAVAPDAAVMAQPIVASDKARVQFKGPRWANDLAVGLNLPKRELCRELGQADCMDEVHHIALGGVEAYRLGVREALPVAPATAAIAAERIALSACIKRVDQDLADPAEAWIFGPLADASGLPDDAALLPLAQALYDKLLRRDATPAEAQALVDFAAEVRADGATQAPARDWAVLTCFAVASSLESLFY